MPKVKLQKTDFEEEFLMFLQLAKKGLRAVVEESGLPSFYFFAHHPSDPAPDKTITVEDIHGVLDGKKKERKSHIETLYSLLKSNDSVGLQDEEGRIIAIVTKKKSKEKSPEEKLLIGAPQPTESKKPEATSSIFETISPKKFRKHWDNARPRLEAGQIISVKDSELLMTFTVSAYHRSAHVLSWMPHTRIGKPDFMEALKGGTVGIKEGKKNVAIAELVLEEP